MSSLGVFAEIHPEFARVLGEQRKPMPQLLNQQFMSSFPEVIALNKFFASDSRYQAPENMVAYLWHNSIKWWVLYQRRPEAERGGPPGYTNFYPVIGFRDYPPQFMPEEWGGVKEPRPMTIEDYFTYIKRGADMSDKEKDDMFSKALNDPFEGADVVTEEMVAAHKAAAKPTDEAEALAEKLTSEMHDYRVGVNPNKDKPIVVGPGSKSSKAKPQVKVDGAVVFTSGDTHLDKAAATGRQIFIPTTPQD